MASWRLVLVGETDGVHQEAGRTKRRDAAREERGARGVGPLPGGLQGAPRGGDVLVARLRGGEGESHVDI